MTPDSVKRIALIIVLTSGLIIKLFAGDTIPERKKLRISLQGGASALSSLKEYDNKGDVITNPFPYFSYSNFLNFALGVDYYLHQNFTEKNTRKLSVGLTYGVNSFDFKSGISNYSESGHFPKEHKFEEVMFNENVKFHYARLHITLDFDFKKWFFSQKIGIELSTPFQPEYTITFTETVSESYPTTSSAYITPSNPEGWYWVNNQKQLTQKNTYQFKSSINPWYSFNIGPRFGKYYLFAGGEISYYGNSVLFESTRINTTSNITLLNYGIIYRAQIGFALDL